MWGAVVVDIKTLMDHCDRYFSGDVLSSDLLSKEVRQSFKKNIIDNFVEGETFVSYE